MLKISIEKVSLAEIDELQEIGRQTFYESFSEENTDEDMNRYLDATFSIPKLTEQVMDKYSEIYFAKFQDEVIGYLKLNFGKSQIHLQDETAIQIERLYLKKENQNKNVGQLLLDKAIEIAQFKRKNYVWLGVWEQNLRAIAFYKRNGFIEFDHYIFTLGTDKQRDIMMKLSLL